MEHDNEINIFKEVHYLLLQYGDGAMANHFARFVEEDPKTQDGNYHRLTQNEQMFWMAGFWMLYFTTRTSEADVLAAHQLMNCQSAQDFLSVFQQNVLPRVYVYPG